MFILYILVMESAKDHLRNLESYYGNQNLIYRDLFRKSKGKKRNKC